MCLCVRERRMREEREIIIFYFLTHYIINLTFPTSLCVPAQREGGWNKDMKAMRKKDRKRQEERGVEAAGISGMIRGYETEWISPHPTATEIHNPQHVLLQMPHRCQGRVPQCRDPHPLQDHFRSTIHFCCACMSGAAVQAQLPHLCTLCPTQTNLHP